MALVLETNVTPPIVLLDGAEGGPLLQLVQPTVSGEVGGFPIEWAPRGRASGIGTIVFYGILTLAAVGAWALLRGLR